MKKILTFVITCIFSIWMIGCTTNQTNSPGSAANTNTGDSAKPIAQPPQDQNAKPAANSANSTDFGKSDADRTNDGKSDADRSNSKK